MYQIGDGMTGRCCVPVKNHDRTCITRLEEAAQLTMDYVQSPAVSNALAAAKVVFMSGFFIHQFPDIAEHVAKQCFGPTDDGSRQIRRKVLVITLSSRAIAAEMAQKLTRSDSQLEAVWHASSFIVSAEREYVAFGQNLPDFAHHLEGQPQDGIDDGKRMLLLGKMSTIACYSGDQPRGVLSTCHEKPMFHGASRVGDKSTGFRSDPVPEHVNLQTIAGDTNGAGDAFTAGVVSNIAMQVTNQYGNDGEGLALNSFKSCDVFVGGEQNRMQFQTYDMCQAGAYAARYK